MILGITDRLVTADDIDNKTTALLVCGDTTGANARATKAMLARKRREWTQRVMAWGYNGGHDPMLEAEFQTRIENERKFANGNQNQNRQAVGQVPVGNGAVSQAARPGQAPATARPNANRQPVAANNPVRRTG